MKFLNKITSIASACFLTLALTGCSDYLDVSDEELAKRKENWTPREPKVTTGYLAR